MDNLESIERELFAAADISEDRHARYLFILDALAKGVGRTDNPVHTIKSTLQPTAFPEYRGDSVSIALPLDALAKKQQLDGEGECVPLTAITTLLGIRLELPVRVNSYPHHVSASITWQDHLYEIDAVRKPNQTAENPNQLQPAAISAMAWSNKASILAQTNDVAGAFAAYDRALAISSIAPVYTSLGMLKEQTGNIAGARDAYARAIDIDSQLAEPRINMAYLAFQEREYDTALGMLDARAERRNCIDDSRARHLRKRISEAR